MELTAKSPAPLKVVRRLKNGGGVIEVPILVEHQVFDWSLTAGGGPTQEPITVEMLAEMESNHAHWPGPIPINVSPHREWSESAGFAPGFLEDVSLRGSALWGRFRLGPQLFREVVDEGGWAGFSVEPSLDLELPAQKFKGWVVRGGVFTNRPSADVNFARAADSQHESAAHGVSWIQIQLASEREKETETMPNEDSITLASHEAKLAPLRTELETAKRTNEDLGTQLEAANKRAADVSKAKETLEADFAELKAKNVTLGAEADQRKILLGHLEKANKALEGKVAELTTKVDQAEKADLSRRVLAVHTEYKGKIPPAYFEGIDGDPAAWMEARFANFDAFKEQVALIAGVPKASLESKSVTSGSDPATKGDPEKGKTDTDKQVDAAFEKAGIKQVADFKGVTSPEEARARFEAAQKKE